ncbi:acetyl-CoA carboxylase carboxyltransferase subunit alpha [Pontibacter sp. G13]|uniref:acetyl-CoA carboxylase carboxyltransferase subunit alpha n=1 Tax=Pontibacter sp. G13 TaxID=3074898 RepID=UPI00288B78AA|nr:acetyl-CoA carboxylase carboxyltransferase subunit alpha [Pontibacter sp. G13]WNJ18928.1 acetyl-CoA carboxylase carboxyltransferase subunit alpha [Pontibacter sp. G13]
MMPNNIFDFEKPIVELESKLVEMRKIADENGVEMEAATADLESKIQDLKLNIYHNLSRWQRVQMSRHPERPYSLDYIHNITDEFVELFGDRNFRDDKAMIGGIGRIGNQSVMFIGQQKGRTTKERQYRNFGMPNPEGYRKALRLMKMAEKFQIPVVCLIDTPGAYPGLEAEERGQGEAIARNLLEMSVLRVPIICVVIGEGASGGALGIGIGDKVYMMENTWYSVISPESCSSILWRSWENKEQAAEALKLTAKDNLRLGIIDGIVNEPLGGAHRNPEDAFVSVKEQLLNDLNTFAEMDVDEMIAKRIDKFTQMGVVREEVEADVAELKEKELA